MANEKCDKYKLMVDRLNNKVNKKEREIENLKKDLDTFKNIEKELNG